ncbi:hypothetical protein C8R45DRAFT_918248 [Mycena sanguinolenta]|nr:hypothetical protein C8R45DRAFT_918248 [Mycena sanguinolenta]
MRRKMVHVYVTILELNHYHRNGTFFSPPKFSTIQQRQAEGWPSTPPRHTVVLPLHTATGTRRNYEKRRAYGWQCMKYDVHLFFAQRSPSYRQQLKEHDTEWEDRKERARVSDKKYRESAYIEKYGIEAYEERKARQKQVNHERREATAREIAEEEARKEAQQARRTLLADYVDSVIGGKKAALESEAARNRTLALNHI